VAACTLQTDCSIGQDCTDGGAGLLCTDVNVAAASTAITSVKTTSPASPVAIVGAIVTYIKPSVSGDQAGFFVQAEQTGPALFVGIDPATLSPEPLVGQRVSFNVTATAPVTGMVTATMDPATWAVLTAGHDASLLKSDVNQATDLVTAVDAYEGRLIGMEFTITASPANANTGYMSALVTTTGLPTGDSHLKFYAPNEIFSGLDLTNGCTAQITNGVMFRYFTTAEPAVWNASDLTVNTCPQPKLLSAVRSSATEVDLTFDRNIAPSTINVAGFVISETENPGNTLTVTAASFDSNDSRNVILTTASQSAGVGYTVTVQSSVKDDLGSGQSVDPAANSATFNGFVGPADLRLTEVNVANTSTDLLELVAVGGGSLDGITVNELTNSHYSFTFPSGYVVQANDVIVLHLSGDCTDPATDAGSCVESFFSAAAWDFSMVATISYSPKVFEIVGPDGVAMDGVALTKSGTPPSSFVTAVNQIQTDGVWDATACTDNASCSAISVDYNGLLVDQTNSVERTAGATPFAVPGDKTQWSALGAQTFGTYP